MKKETYQIIIGFLVFCVFASGVASYIITSAKYVNYVEMLEQDNIRLTDDNWTLHFKLQAEQVETPD